MAKHSQEFIEKHQRLIEQRIAEKIEKKIAKTEKHQRLIEQRIAEKIAKVEKKMLARLDKYHEKKKKKREAYQLAKENNTPEYQQYLAEQRVLGKKYREKYKLQREENNKKKIDEAIGDERFGVYINKKGFKCYVTESGRIINRFGKVTYGYNGHNGYKIYDGEMLHRVVWEAFNGKIPEGFEIDHIVPVKNGGGNELSNLRLTTHKDNCNNPLSIINYQIHNKQVDRSYLKKNNFRFSRII